jgi:uncharacterized membrane protein YcgQ (UPF0703/DUF1980 family)
MKKTLILALTLCFCLLTGCKSNTALANLSPGSGGGATNGVTTNNGGSSSGETSSIDGASLIDGASAIDNASAAGPTDISTDIPDRSDEVVEIKEKMFVAQSNDIYYNYEDYLGKTIKYEGMMDSYTDLNTEMTYYSVIRYGPGCCGIDANCGFEVMWTDDTSPNYPKDNEWVEAVGVLKEYEELGYSYLLLELTSLTVLDERGAEYVTQ